LPAGEEAPVDPEYETRGRQRDHGHRQQDPRRGQVRVHRGAEVVAGQDVDRCPGQRRDRVDQEERARPHVEDARHQRDHRADRTDEAADGHALGTVAREEALAVGDPLGIAAKRPGALDVVVEDAPEQEADAVAGHGARERREQAFGQAERARAGHEGRHAEQRHAGHRDAEDREGFREGDQRDRRGYPGGMLFQPGLEGARIEGGKGHRRRYSCTGCGHPPSGRCRGGACGGRRAGI
jgi:hypothetical protein